MTKSNHMYVIEELNKEIEKLRGKISVWMAECERLNAELERVKDICIKDLLKVLNDDK